MLIGMNRRQFLAGFLVTPSALCSGANSWADDSEYHAAIAYSKSTGLSGYSYGYSSRTAAENAAVEACNARDAVVLTWTRNAWTALATADDRSYYGHAWGNTAEEAMTKALAACSKVANSPCRIHTCVFAKPGGVDFSFSFDSDFTDAEKNILRSSLNLLRWRLVVQYVVTTPEP
jgi:hypothetical protein